MENRRADDPWKKAMETRIDDLETHLNERFEKTNMLLQDILDAWDLVRSGFKFLTFLGAAFKWLAPIIGGFVACWLAVQKYFGKG